MSNNLKSFTILKARALAHALGSCGCHHTYPKGGSLHEDASRIIERYEHPKCACYRLIQELTPEQAREAVALYLWARDMPSDENGQYCPSEDLEHFRTLAERYEAIRVLRYIFIEKKLNIALDFLEGIPALLAESKPSTATDPTWWSDAVDIED